MIRRVLPLAGALYALLATTAHADHGRHFRCHESNTSSWDMIQPQDHADAGYWPNWSDCLAWRNGDPGPDYIWSYGQKASNPATTTTQTTTTTSTTSTTTTVPETTTTKAAALPLCYLGVSENNAAPCLSTGRLTTSPVEVKGFSRGSPHCFPKDDASSTRRHLLSEWRDLNSRPWRPKRPALPNCATLGRQHYCIRLRETQPPATDPAVDSTPPPQTLPTMTASSTTAATVAPTTIPATTTTSSDPPPNTDTTATNTVTTASTINESTTTSSSTSTTLEPTPPAVVASPKLAPGSSRALAPGVTPEAQRAIVAAAVTILLPTATSRRPK